MLPSLLGLLLLFLFPFYLIYFFIIRHRAKALHLGPEAKLGYRVLIFYFVVIIISLSFAGTMLGFQNFQPKAKQSEAKSNLAAIYQAQLSYFSQTNTYAGGKNAFKLIGWKPSGQNRYAYYLGDSFVPNLSGVEIPFRPGADWPFPTQPESSKTGFTALAIGDVDADECLDLWIINDQKVLNNKISDINSSISEGMGTICPKTRVAKSRGQMIEERLAENVLPLIFNLILFVLLFPLIREFYRDHKRYKAALLAANRDDGQSVI